MSFWTFSTGCPVWVAMISSMSRLRPITSRTWKLDVRRLSLEAVRPLVDQDLRVRQRPSLPFRPARENDRAHRHRYADADRRDVRLDELHRVVDREPGVHVAARRVGVDRDLLVGLIRLEVEKVARRSGSRSDRRREYRGR